jgi:hypothetical protein
MMVQSEKHLMHLDDPAKDINKVEIHPDRMAEMRMDYLVHIPEAATSTEEEMFWGPIKDKRALQAITHLPLAKSDDRQILALDEKDKEARMKILAKMEKEKDKIVMYDRRTQAKIRAQQQNSAQLFGILTPTS